MKIEYSIKEVMRIFNISKRTLHYYDEIGLLVPKKNLQNQYRYYSQENINALQRILFYKEIGLSIKEIQLMKNKTEDERRAYLLEFESGLKEKIDGLNHVANQLSKYLGGSPMSELAFNDQLGIQYENEAKIKYGGSSAYQEFTRRQDRMTADEKKEWQKNIKKGLIKVFAGFDKVSTLPIESEEVKAAVMNWKEKLMEITDYSDEVLVMIAEGYQTDPRFKTWFDPFDNDQLIGFVRKSVRYHLGHSKE